MVHEGSADDSQNHCLNFILPEKEEEGVDNLKN